jgi:hypothetical protein
MYMRMNGDVGFMSLTIFLLAATPSPQKKMGHPTCHLKTFSSGGTNR